MASITINNQDHNYTILGTLPTARYTNPTVRVDDWISASNTSVTGSILDNYLWDVTGTSITAAALDTHRLYVSGAIDSYSIDATTDGTQITYTTTDIETYRVLGNIDGKQDLVRRQMKENMRSSVIRNRTHLDWSNPTPAELKARETLRDMITEAEWRRYVTNAFIMVRGASGNWYQIFGRRYERLRVYRDGKQIQAICIHTDEKCPPTDHVLNMKILIEIDEQAVLQGGNITKISNYERPKLHVVNRVPINQVKGLPIRVYGTTPWAQIA